ncbi:MAG: hypothetical protein E7361_02545 [Clostridiales bacterium]|nr:hypothetical protein [Clostridiales bacterium]
MKTKQKVLVITIIAVMAFAIIGLTIGLVLVAQQATLNNSMSVSYTANNVDATITATAMNYANATGTSTSDKVITIGDEELETSTITFDAAQSEATNSLKFNDTDMTAAGRLVYKFTIKNTANAENSKILKFAANFPGASLAENNNANIYMGLSETALKSITRNELDRFYVSEIGGGQAETTLYAVISVDDATIDINNLELSLNITLEYATEGNITKNVTTNIINESNIPSVIEVGNYYGGEIPKAEVISFIEYTYSSTYDSNFSKTHNPNGFDIGQDFLVVSLNYRIYGAPANYTFTYSNAEGEQQSVTKYFNGKYIEYDDATDEYNTNYIVLFYGSFFLESSASMICSMEDFNIADGTTITITITPAE